MQEDIDRFGDVGSLEDNVESFLSNDGDGRDLYGTIKQSPPDLQREPSKGKLSLRCVCAEFVVASSFYCSHAPFFVFRFYFR